MRRTSNRNGTPIAVVFVGLGHSRNIELVVYTVTFD